MEGQTVCCHYSKGNPDLPDYVPPFESRPRKGQM